MTMRRVIRIFGTAMAVGGVGVLVWVVVVWQWQDPFTALYTHWKQHQLAQSLDREFADFHPVRIDRTDLAGERREVAKAAARFRKTAREGQAIGRITIGR